MNTVYKIKIFLSLCIGLIALIGEPVNAQEMEKEVLTTKVFTIENCVNSFSMEDTIKTDAGYQYWFADKDFLDGRTLKMSVVAPHKSTHAPHKHIEDEFFFILEGTASFYLDGKTKEVGKYTSLYCPSNVMHGITNAGDTELKYLVIKKYQKD
jgi:mannose-6-phosphate isomerase-like protein (cupin superfamily)